MIRDRRTRPLLDPEPKFTKTRSAVGSAGPNAPSPCDRRTRPRTRTPPFPASRVAAWHSAALKRPSLNLSQSRARLWRSRVTAMSTRSRQQTPAERSCVRSPSRSRRNARPKIKSRVAAEKAAILVKQLTAWHGRCAIESYAGTGDNVPSTFWRCPDPIREGAVATSA